MSKLLETSYSGLGKKWRKKRGIHFFGFFKIISPFPPFYVFSWQAELVRWAATDMHYFLPTDPPALAFAAWMGDELHPILDSSTTPILGFDDRAAEQEGSIFLLRKQPFVLMGTGTFFRVGDHHFIVTAAHVIHEIEKARLALSIPCGDPPRSEPFQGNCLLADGIPDLALLPLPSTLIDGMTHQRFLRLSDVEFRQDLGQGWCFLHGYPSLESYHSKDWLTFTTVSFTHRTGLYYGSTAAFRNYNSAYHILLDYSGEPRSADDASPAHFPPSLRGISGSSIWLGFSERHLMDEWTTNSAKVVAIETSVYPETKVVQGTRWAGAAMVLWQNYPELRDEILAYLPASLHEDFRSVVK